MTMMSNLRLQRLLLMTFIVDDKFLSLLPTRVADYEKLLSLWPSCTYGYALQIAIANVGHNYSCFGALVIILRLSVDTSIKLLF